MSLKTFLPCRLLYLISGSSFLLEWRVSLFHKSSCGIPFLNGTSNHNTAKKIKFSIRYFFSKCEQIRSFLRIWSHLLKKSLMENFIFLCSVNFIYTMYLTDIFIKAVLLFQRSTCSYTFEWYRHYFRRPLAVSGIFKSTVFL